MKRRDQIEMLKTRRAFTDTGEWREGIVAWCFAKADRAWRYAMTDPTPGAIEAASNLLAHLDADHITEIRATSWKIATDRIAKDFDAFAAEAVQRERERCAWWARAHATHPEINATVLAIESGSAKK